ncbi:hypothetical protein Plec18170_005369 [Paecilomyces lecythidis]
MQQNSRATEQRGGKRKSIGKRKLSDHGEAPQQQQTTISELLARNNTPLVKDQHSGPSSPSTYKRLRASSPSANSPALDRTQDLISPEKMYNFSNSEPKAGEAFAQRISGSDTSPAALRARAYNASSRPSNFTPHTGAKKLVVKNLRAGPRLNQDAYFDKVWAQLDAALVAIFDSRKPDASLEELYKGAENVCRQGRAAVLAKKLQEKCREHISGKLRQGLLSRSADGDNVEILRAVVAAWNTWNSTLVTIRWIFYYLDQSFLLHSKDFPVIHEMGLIQFRSHIFSDSELKPKILQGVCDLVLADRKEDNATSLDSTLLRQAIGLFHDLSVYTSDFEPQFLAESENFFTSWADAEAEKYLATYVENCHRLIEREVSRCDLYSLSRNTRQKLAELLDDNLVTRKEDVLLDQNEVLGLLRTGNKIALERLYTLLERRSLGSRLKSAFIAHIIDEGSAIVFDQERESEMIVRLLDFKKQLDDTWLESFHKDEVLGHALREAFETFMNKGKKSESSWGTDNPKTGEMIAKYVDMLLKGGLKVLPGRKTEDVSLADEDAELNRQLDQVLDLFRFVHGKAVFEAFYKNDLARRLLMGRKCGSSFTHNLESMFKDMDLARDEMASYNSLQRERREKPGLDLNVHVLSSAAWPTYPDVPVRIPQNVQKAINDFEQFYHNKYNGRKLHWKHQLAHCQLRARFPKGDKELVVSSFQAIVLLLFNDVPEGETLSYPQIQEATGLSDPELKRTLQSLACAKYRVLSKKPKGKEIDPTDIFAYNTNFSDAKMRIKINQIQLKETKEENKTTHERVAADRHYETQAAIVRIMKSRKIITHAELVAEVIKATRSRGVLEPAEIKKNIEKLIEKDYMEREEGNRYSYLA